MSGKGQLLGKIIPLPEKNPRLSRNTSKVFKSFGEPSILENMNSMTIGTLGRQIYDHS